MALSHTTTEFGCGNGRRYGSTALQNESKKPIVSIAFGMFVADELRASSVISLCGSCLVSAMNSSVECALLLVVAGNLPSQHAVHRHGSKDGKLAVDWSVHHNVSRQSSTREASALEEVFARLVRFISANSRASSIYCACFIAQLTALT